MAGELLYLDSSAIVKLVVAEPETPALRRLLAAWPERVSSVVARIEVHRVARRIGATPPARAREILRRIALVHLDEPVIQAAATLDPPALRTLDAIHLATARSLGDDLGAICTYDARLAEAAAALGMEVLTPA
jgi:predicted nucleic acid-binding protein